MRVLKFFLYVILVVCVVWGALILFGPSLIKRSVNAYLGDNVEISRLSVSPRLEVEAGMVRATFADMPTTALNNFLARGVKVSWSITNWRPVLVLQSGFLTVNSEISVEGVEASFVLDLNKPTSASFTAGVRNVQRQGLEALNSSITGLLNVSTMSFNDLNMSAEQIVITSDPTSIVVSTLEIIVPELTANAALSGQNISAIGHGLAMEIDNFASITNPQFSFSSEFSNGTLLLSGETVRFNGVDTTVNDLSIKTRVDTTTGELGPDYSVSAAAINLEALQAEFENYSANIKVTSENITHVADVVGKSITIKSGQNYIGELEETPFNLVSKISLKANAAAIEHYSTATIESRNPIAVAIGGQAEIFYDQMYECLQSQCALRNLLLQYQIELDGSSMTGKSECRIGPSCIVSKMRHSLNFKDTDKFFSGIRAANIFSPLALSVAYLTARSGDKTEQGHILHFD